MRNPDLFRAVYHGTAPRWDEAFVCPGEFLGLTPQAIHCRPSGA